jgi:hypothetical protein
VTKLKALLHGADQWSGGDDRAVEETTKYFVNEGGDLSPISG